MGQLGKLRGGCQPPQMGRLAIGRGFTTPPQTQYSLRSPKRLSTCSRGVILVLALEMRSIIKGPLVNDDRS